MEFDVKGGTGFRGVGRNLTERLEKCADERIHGKKVSDGSKEGADFFDKSQPTA